MFYLRGKSFVEEKIYKKFLPSVTDKKKDLANMYTFFILFFFHSFYLYITKIFLVKQTDLSETPSNISEVPVTFAGNF